MPRVDRLLKLAEFLESPAVDQNKFDMKHWYKEETGCYCAIGWAVKLRLFAELQKDKPEWSFCPIVQDEYGWCAITDFFGLSLTHAVELFAFDEDEPAITPQKLAKKIRAFTEEHLA